MPRGAGAGARLQVYLEVLLGKALAVRASGQLGYQCASGIGKCLTCTTIAVGRVTNDLLNLSARTLRAEQEGGPVSESASVRFSHDLVTRETDTRVSLPKRDAASRAVGRSRGFTLGSGLQPVGCAE